MRPLAEILSDRRVRPLDTEDYGAAFKFVSTQGKWPLLVVASCGLDWDHVSVSRRGNSMPTWADMQKVRHLCFYPHEVAMQLHVADDDHINFKDNCLHIWRPHHVAIPLPPKILV
jgi:hypothetical protein